jgi:hypothetical protein
MAMPDPSERAVREMHAIGDGLADRGIERGSMFGTPALKAGTKVVCNVWGDDLVVKLPPAELDAALRLKGAVRFAPMPARPMKEWAQVPFSHAKRWPALVEAAVGYVGGPGASR